MNLLNINKQIDELSHLKDGWLDGKGKALGRENLEWLKNMFDTLYNLQLPFPRLYPTLEGNIQAEWSSESYEISLKIILDNKTGYYQFLDLKTNNCIDLKFNLNNELDCKKLSQELFSSINLKEILL